MSWLPEGMGKPVLIARAAVFLCRFVAFAKDGDLIPEWNPDLDLTINHVGDISVPAFKVVTTLGDETNLLWNVAPRIMRLEEKQPYHHYRRPEDPHPHGHEVTRRHRKDSRVQTIAQFEMDSSLSEGYEIDGMRALSALGEQPTESPGGLIAHRPATLGWLLGKSAPRQALPRVWHLWSNQRRSLAIPLPLTENALDQAKDSNWLTAQAQVNVTSTPTIGGTNETSDKTLSDSLDSSAATCDWEECELFCCCALPFVMRGMRSIWLDTGNMFTRSLGMVATTSGLDPNKISDDMIVSLRSRILLWLLGMIIFSTVSPPILIASGVAKREIVDNLLDVLEVHDWRRTFKFVKDTFENSRLWKERGVAEEEEEQEGQSLDIGRFLSQTEKDKLGGVDHWVRAQFGGMTTIRFFIITLLSLGTFAVLITPPVTRFTSVLGNSGRILVVTRRPSMEIWHVKKYFMAFGMATYVFTLASVICLNLVQELIATETSLETRAEGLSCQIFGYAINKETQMRYRCYSADEICVIGLAAWYLCFSIYVRLTFRSWGFSVDKTYYESEDCCVCQYTRSGSRGIIPCYSPRTRWGTFRAFFGPFPEKDIFERIAKGTNTMRQLTPMLLRPESMGDGTPPVGSGQADSTAAGRIGKIQFAINFCNGIFGVLGVLFFVFRVYDVFTNASYCPSPVLVDKCLLEDGLCQPLSRVTWFLSRFSQEMNWSTRQQRDFYYYDSDVKIDDTSDLSNLLGMPRAKVKEKVYQWMKDACDVHNNTFYRAMLSPDQAGIRRTTAFASLYIFKEAIEYLNLERGMVDDSALGETPTCRGCSTIVFMSWLCDVENIIEILEMLFIVTCAYYSAEVIRMLSSRLEDYSSVEISFRSNPGSKDDFDVNEVEARSLRMMAKIVGYKYFAKGVPPHLARLERSLHAQRDGVMEQKQKQIDPWRFVVDQEGWDFYNFTEGYPSRVVNIDEKILFILKQEEVVGAWSERGDFSREEKLIMGTIFFATVVVPSSLNILRVLQGYSFKPQCLIETTIGLLIGAKLIEFLVIRRIPQAGYVLTTRRLYQINRRPAYRDLLGKTEPFILIDVLVHNSGITYCSMTMEAYVPILRRCTHFCLRQKAYRRGALVAQSDAGVFKVNRNWGDASNLMFMCSRLSLTYSNPLLNKRFGTELTTKEVNVLNNNRLLKEMCRLGDPPLACLCCPYSPPRQAGMSLLDQYVVRKKSEEDCYLLAVGSRPVSVREFLCGRGLRCELSCCCCCMIDEHRNEFVLTNHIYLLEQRTEQRYCRCCWCGRSVPATRATFLSHFRAKAYEKHEPVKPYGVYRMRSDLNMRILVSGERTFDQALTFYQRPYHIFTHTTSMLQKPWLLSVVTLFDRMTTEVEQTNDGLDLRDVKDLEDLKDRVQDRIDAWLPHLPFSRKNR